MARCLAGHETANTDFCDICGARVNATSGFGPDRGAGKHRGPDRGTVSDGRICPGCGAPAPGPFCDACGLRLAKGVVLGERRHLLGQKRWEDVVQRARLDAHEPGVGVIAAHLIVEANDLARRAIEA